MKTSVFWCLISFFVPVYLSAQPPNRAVRVFGGEYSDILISVVKTDNRELAVAGYTSSMGEGELDFYLAKFDSQGTMLWSRTYGGPRWDEVYQAAVTQNGGFILVGTSNSINQLNFDMCVVMTNHDGDTIWTRMFDGGADEVCTSVIVNQDGGFYLGGITTSDSAEYISMYLVRIDSLGDTLWTRKYGGDWNDICMDMDATPDSGLILAGSTFSFDSDHRDIYLVKIDENGNMQWQNHIPLPRPNYCNSIISLPDGSYVLCGTTHPYETSEESDIFIVKVDSQGDTIWTRTYGRNSWDEGKSIYPLSDGGFIIAGYSYSSAGRNTDTFIFEIDSVGDLMWTQIYDGGGWDEARDVIAMGNGRIVAVGHTTSADSLSADFCLLMSNRGFNCWFSNNIDSLKKKPVKSTALSLYPNPFNPTVTAVVELPETSRLRLTLINTLGQEAAVITDGEYLKGRHSFTFDGSQLSSGIYFLHARVPGKMNELKKVVLLR